MTNPHEQIEQLLEKLPQISLSNAADKRIKSLLRERSAELGLRPNPWLFWQRLVAVPVALAVVLVSTTGYAYTSTSVVSGDALFTVKAAIETWMYPASASPEERVAYHLNLSDRRYAEVFEILKRKSFSHPQVTALPSAFAQESPSSRTDEALRQTLQSASRNTEAAVEIATEITDVQKVKKVQQSIRSTVTRQKQVLSDIAPVLTAISLREEVRGEEPEEKGLTSIPSPSPEMAAVQPLSGGDESPESADTMESPEPITMAAPKPASNLKELLEEESARQEALLERLSLSVASAEKEGKTSVNNLGLIEASQKVLKEAPSAPESESPVPQPYDAYERLFETATEAHKKSQQDQEKVYQKLFTPVIEPTTTEPITEPSAEPESPESGTVEQPTLAPSPYEKEIPSTTTRTPQSTSPPPMSEVEKERQLLEQEWENTWSEEKQQIQPSPQSQPEQKVPTKYELPIAPSSKTGTEHTDPQLEKERGLLERE